MKLELDTENGNSYRVEVSGWDASGNFFVKNTTLDWEEEEAKRITLRSSLRQGCVLFVRLLQPLASSKSFPIAYQASRVSAKDGEGRVRVCLDRLRARTPLKTETPSVSDAIIRVA